MDQALNQKIDAYIAENKEQLLQDIAALVAIDSVEGTPEEGAPFGAGPRAALDKTLELAAGMGFATRNCENYIGYAELAGADPEKYLATICHVDVVPVGNGWTADPFKMRIQDGWLLGRGVSDDKGPMIVTLYALKFLKEQGYQLRYPIRAIVGDNEETHMNDVKYYLENYPAPVFCFTPDAEFPVCNGEKGHFGAELVSPVCNGEIKEFEGGVANNAVPDRASALVETDITKLKNAPNITLEPEGNGVRIRGWGKSGHAAMPEGTVNAIGLVVNYLLDNGLCNDAERAYLEADSFKVVLFKTDENGIRIQDTEAEKNEDKEIPCEWTKNGSNYTGRITLNSKYVEVAQCYGIELKGYDKAGLEFYNGSKAYRFSVQTGSTPPDVKINGYGYKFRLDCLH